MTKERTWEISDIDGKNKRTVTLAQYRAEVDAAKTRASAIHAANVANLAHSPAFTEVSNIQEYGLTQKLSNSIRVF